METLANVVRFLGNPIPSLNRNLQRYGHTYAFYLGGRFRSIFTTDPAFIQHVFQKKHRQYVRTPNNMDKLGFFLGKSLLTTEGDYWLRQRRLLQPGFHRERLAHITSLMQAEVDRFLNDEAQLPVGRPIDISKPILMLTLRIIARAMFSDTYPEATLQQISHTITSSQDFVVKQIRLPLLTPYYRFTGRERREAKANRLFRDLLLNKIRERKVRGTSQDDLLQMMLYTRYADTGGPLTEQQLLDEIMTLFVAGHETTANALSWTTYLLLRNPEWVERIRTERNELLGSAQPTFDNLGGLPILKAVIQEGMRLYPPVWINDRTAKVKDAFEGISIEPGTLVIAYILGAHRHPDYWTDPERFDPSRFLESEKGAKHDYAYLPFGAGPHLCIGNHFSMMEMQLVLSSLLQKFDLHTAIIDNPQPLPLITLRPDREISVRLERRSF